MDILDYAMRMELDGKLYYETSASKMPTPELRQILLTLAEEEVKHYHFFKRLKESGSVAAREVIDAAPPSTLAVKNVFQQMVENGQSNLYGEDVVSIWRKALDIEEKAVKLYSEEAGKENDVARRELLQQIADEEKNHVYLIENMLAFMADPSGFIDSANYQHFQSWEGHGGG
jgi:rubrerythrin